MPPIPRRPTFEVDENPKSRTDLEKFYNVSSQSGRVLLALDADGLRSREKALLHVFASRCGGPKCTPHTTIIDEKTMQYRSCMGLGAVKRGLDDLVKRGLIERKRRSDTSSLTTVHWEKVRHISYRWTTMLKFEEEDKQRKASAKSDHEAPAQRSFTTKNDFEYPENDEDKAVIASFDPPSLPVAAEVEEELSEEDRDFFETYVEIRGDRVAYDVPQAFDNLDGLVAYCKARGIAPPSKVKGRHNDRGRLEEWDLIRSAPRFKDYAARRLREHTGRDISASDMIPLEKMIGADLYSFHDYALVDPYSILEYALITHSWCDLLKAETTRSPVAMLKSVWHEIAASWTKAGGLRVHEPRD
jgi:DNA-binding MarR family transcriptional regulator